MRTCLVIHSQDPTAENLMGCKIGTSPTICNTNLSAVRLETTKMLLEPLNRLKKEDARLNLTQGILEGVVGEELGVLPGMDSIFSVKAIEELVGFLGGSVGGKNHTKENYDIIVYDGTSTEETLRIISAPEKARWYLKYFRNMAEKTDIGRLTSPSLMKLADEAVKLHGGSIGNGRTSADMWDDVDQNLKKASAAFAEQSKFGCYIVMDPNSRISVACALRYWGCAIQAGAQISGAFGLTRQSCMLSSEVTENLLPLPFAFLPYLSTDSPVEWDVTLKVLDKDVQNILSTAGSNFRSSVKFDSTKKSVTLFMPGFDKSEIKLYQYRGGSELLVEAGDQRRIITLPYGIQGKVCGAKFVDRSLVITLR
ncbi:P-loop containing nucleoside triphosphate hydrolases superfamily protein isoform X2 [Tasmannia lanceolata]